MSLFMFEVSEELGETSCRGDTSMFWPNARGFFLLIGNAFPSELAPGAANVLNKCAGFACPASSCRAWTGSESTTQL